MNITWYGQSCFKIEVSSQNEDISIVIDPFDAKKVGLKLPSKLTADLALQTNGKLAYPVETRDGKTPFIISGPGEYEFKGIFVYAIPLSKHLSAKQGGTEYIVRIEAEDMTLVHTGALDHVPSDADLQEIEGLDILFIPVGGHGLLDAKKATELISKLEPRMVIPMQYKIPELKEEYDSLQLFLKEVGVKHEEMPKLKIIKKNLPIDEMKVIVLEKS